MFGIFGKKLSAGMKLKIAFMMARPCIHAMVGTRMLLLQSPIERAMSEMNPGT
jgi:hypothetical protein